MPIALQCLQTIRMISQFISDVKGSSYFNDSDMFLLNFCKTKKQSMSKEASVGTVAASVDSTKSYVELKVHAIPFSFLFLILTILLVNTT